MDIATLTLNQRNMLALFDIKAQITVQYAYRKLGLPRPTTKQVLSRLVELGYVERNGKQRGTYYSLRTEEKVLDEFGNDVVRVYKGKEAFLRFFRSLHSELKQGDFYWSFAFKSEYYDSEIGAFLLNYHTELTRKNVEDKTLVHEEVKIKVAQTYRNVPNLQIKSTMQEIPTGMSITRNRIANLVWGDHPMIIEIKSPVIVERYQKFFESVWSKSFTVSKPTHI
ncbi:MAG TPA: helix-turn-helix domain-containing protein [Patescibacteria group bacterium]